VVAGSKTVLAVVKLWAGEGESLEEGLKLRFLLETQRFPTPYIPSEESSAALLSVSPGRSPKA